MAAGSRWQEDASDRDVHSMPSPLCNYAAMHSTTTSGTIQLCTECNALHTTTTMQLYTPYNHHYATMNSIPPPLCIQYAIRPPTYNYAPTMIYTKTMLWAMPPLSTMQCKHARLHPQSSIYLAFCPPPLCALPPGWYSTLWYGFTAITCPGHWRECSWQ